MEKKVFYELDKDYLLSMTSTAFAEKVIMDASESKYEYVEFQKIEYWELSCNSVVILMHIKSKSKYTADFEWADVVISYSYSRRMDYWDRRMILVSEARRVIEFAKMERGEGSGV